jgi:hypothetical protein
MPLHDHFREPLAILCPWTSFHAAWATFIAAELNQRLPSRYSAVPLAKFAIEIDVAALDRPTSATPTPGVAPEAWAPGAPQLTVPFTTVTDVVEILISHFSGGPTLAAAIELISPSNKDWPESRDAFVSKCATYLQNGVGLVLVDVVTERRANLHCALLARVTPGVQAEDAALYATSYHPVKREERTTLDVWHEELRPGQPLPILPLWLRGGHCLPLPLEETYEQTMRSLRLQGNGS